jgi:hypothetical protein
MMRCNICLGLGGLFCKDLRQMREIYRPVHSGYETLRLRRDKLGRESHEQMTALNFDMQSRRQSLFVQGYSR